MSLYSPVPAMIRCRSLGSIAIAPMARLIWKSLFGCQSRPPSVVFQTPPQAVPMYIVSGSIGSNAQHSVRPAFATPEFVDERSGADGRPVRMDHRKSAKRRKLVEVAQRADAADLLLARPRRDEAGQAEPLGQERLGPQIRAAGLLVFVFVVVFVSLFVRALRDLPWSSSTSATAGLLSTWAGWVALT